MSESGKVKGANNVKVFDEFINQHNELKDWYKYVNASRKKISRELICKECGFGKSALIQNPILKNKFQNLQWSMEQKGTLMTQLSRQLDFEYPGQEDFIKEYEKKINQFRANVNKFKKTINIYAQELEILD